MRISKKFKSGFALVIVLAIFSARATLAGTTVHDFSELFEPGYTKQLLSNYQSGKDFRIDGEMPTFSYEHGFLNSLGSVVGYLNNSHPELKNLLTGKYNGDLSSSSNWVLKIGEKPIYAFCVEDTNRNGVIGDLSGGAFTIDSGDKVWLTSDIEFNGVAGAIDQMPAYTGTSDFLAVPSINILTGSATKWQGGTGTWNTLSGWDAELPDSDTYAHIDGGGVVSLASGIAQSHALYVGYTGTATMIQTGGMNNVANDIYVGNALGACGNYELSDIGEINTKRLTVGRFGEGVVIQGGGVLNTDELRLGYGFESEGTYEMSSGQLSVGKLQVGQNGTGQFTHDGGTVTSNELYIGANAYDESPSSGTGTYTLNDGALESYYVLIGGGTGSGTGHFIQNGGTQNNLGLIIGYGSEGSYEMNNGLLSVMTGAGSAGIGIGFGANGEFIQNGGTVVTQSEFGEAGSGHMSIGGPGGDGLYRLTAGQLSTGSISIGLSSDFMGDPQTYGTFVIDGGSVFAGSLYIAGNGDSWVENTTKQASHGEFQITNSSSHIEISETLYIGLNGVLNTVDAGSTIHMTGSSFENESINPANLIGLANLTLIFEGGIEDVDPFEVAGEDLGTDIEGYDLNFALGTLQIGGEDIGQLQLVNSFDNRPDWEGTEALYVENLILGTGSLLDLNGFNLYYKNLTNLGGNINLNGGSMIQIPEPCTIALLALGGLAFLRRRNKKYK